MKTRMLGILLMGLCFLPLHAQDAKSEYLKKVLHNLEQIKSATYREQAFVWMPGDTIPRTYSNYLDEYDNPNDTTIGASCIIFQDDNRKMMKWGYNGTICASIYQEDKEVIIEDYVDSKRPFRPLRAPFFNYAKSILTYAFTTQDSISTTLEDLGKEYHFKLIIHEDEQVEFFGKAYHMYVPFLIADPTSQYELWIKKENNLPHKMRRTMCTETTMSICTEVELNTLSLSDLDLYSYFPEGYEVRKRGEKRKEQPKEHTILDKQAPAWTLRGADERPMSLSDIQSKVIVLNFTGIGCGPCKLSIPFLNSLKEKYSPEEVSVVSIESWQKKLHSIRVYIDHEHINYPLLEGSDEVLKAYLGNSRGVPHFFILDADRVVRKAFNGYALNTTDKEIKAAIDECLAE